MTIISRFLCNFFPKWPLIFLLITIHQVIWLSPGTLPGGRTQEPVPDRRTGALPSSDPSVQGLPIRDCARGCTYHPDRSLNNYFSIFVRFFSPNGPSFFDHHDSPSNLASPLLFSDNVEEETVCDRATTGGYRDSAKLLGSVQFSSHVATYKNHCHDVHKVRQTSKWQVSAFFYKSEHLKTTI